MLVIFVVNGPVIDSSQRFFNLTNEYFSMSSKPKLKITVLKRLDPQEMFDTLPVTLKKPMGPCSIFHDGQVIHVDESLRMPDGFCETAWRNFYHNIRTLGYGGGLPFFEETNVAINSCTDGMRPVIFKIEQV